MASCCFASIQALHVGLSRGEDKNKLEGVRNPALHARFAVSSEMVKEEATKESAMEELEELSESKANLHKECDFFISNFEAEEHYRLPVLPLRARMGQRASDQSEKVAETEADTSAYKDKDLVELQQLAAARGILFDSAAPGCGMCK
ncbi:hypothetical protein AK812_SmicGene42117 [Symbiodinium microadriaticum]|uniref:Uncharacterized protein n=1 Tax=Symbiodinium microadriaticum TaxID=2951 RepID=A0A1Q9C4E0_SYMMI|nr:hypothetical protein AK812_SmicGene42117 [Symbiodinium microadriaticum]